MDIHGDTEVAGFEPANTAVKVLCLTTWRYPNIKEVGDGRNRTYQSLANAHSIYFIKRT